MTNLLREPVGCCLVLAAALTIRLKFFAANAAQWYRDTDTIAFRTQLCSISAHAEVLPRLRAQQRSGMIGIGIGGALGTGA
jgi:hypothetical protein